MPPILIDTNVLVYAYDRAEHKRQGQAIDVLDQLQATGKGCLSVQCLAEFFQVTARGRSPILKLDEAATQVELLMRAFPVFNLTQMVVLEAVRGVREHQMPYFDSQIWAVARLNQVPTIFSEDFSNGLVLEGVRFVNPFIPEFVIERWLV